MAEDVPPRRAADGCAVYGARPGDLSIKIFCADLSNGRRELTREVTNNDPAGLLGLTSAGVSSGGTAYTYFRTLSDLFTVAGLK